MNGTQLGCFGFLVVGFFKLLIRFLLFVSGLTCISIVAYYIFVASRSLISGLPVENLVVHLILSIVILVVGIFCLKFALFKHKKNNVDNLQGES